jgi:hypothetical protein
MSKGRSLINLAAEPGRPKEEDLRLGSRSVEDIVHRDPHVTFVVDALPVADQQDLGAFMVDPEGVGHSIGDGAVADQVQVIKVDRVRLLGSVQPAFYYRADGTPGAVFENELGTVGRSFPDLF